MSIETIKKEAYYYLGKHITDDEAAEVADFVSQNPGASLCEILADYFSC